LSLQRQLAKPNQLLHRIFLNVLIHNYAVLLTLQILHEVILLPEALICLEMIRVIILI